MKEISKKKGTRYRCDHCKKLIPLNKESVMVEMDGTPFSAFDDRWYHFCNKNQWKKTFNNAYQLRLYFLEEKEQSPA